MTYDANGHYQVPSDNFDIVLKIFRYDRNGKSRREISEAVEVPLGTVQNVLDRRYWYAKREKMSESGSKRILS